MDSKDRTEGFFEDEEAYEVALKQEDYDVMDFHCRYNLVWSKVFHRHRNWYP